MPGQINPERDLLGLPLPSQDPEFIAVLGIHIFLSLTALISGVATMLKDKNSPAHAKFGIIYYWSIVLAFMTVIVLTMMRWPHNNHLFAMGLLAAVLVIVGRTSARKKKRSWAKYHAMCMGGSFILLLTGFYVDNGQHLPFWKHFPQWFFWAFPSAIGVPVIYRVLRTHPMTR